MTYIIFDLKISLRLICCTLIYIVKTEHIERSEICKSKIIYVFYIIKKKISKNNKKMYVLRNHIHIFLIRRFFRNFI